jgi:hypothetical protein
MKSFPMIVVVLIMLGVDTTFGQQTDTARLQAYIDVAVAGSKTLKGYNWKMTVQDVQVETAPVTRTFDIQWNANGQITGRESSAGNKALPEGTTDWVRVLVDYILGYIAAPESKLVSFYKNAHIEPDAGVMMELSGSNFVRDDDKVTIDIDRNIFIIRRLTFTSLLDDDDLMGTIEYEVDNNSFKYPAKIRVDVPAKRLRLTFSNENFIKR